MWERRKIWIGRERRHGFELVSSYRRGKEIVERKWRLREREMSIGRSGGDLEWCFIGSIVRGSSRKKVRGD